MIDLFKSRRRKRLRALPLPAEWERIIERNVAVYHRLTAEDRREHNEIADDDEH